VLTDFGRISSLAAGGALKVTKSDQKGLFSWLRPAPIQEEITDAEEIARSYKYWRYRTFYSMFFGYVLYYFTRKSFVFAMPALMDDLHFNEAQLGMVASALSIAYAFSKFGSGILADRSNPRYFMAFGLIMTGVVNLIFGMGASVLFFTVTWAANGLFQGFGAPPCARLMVYWYSPAERGRWWAAWNTAHNVGGWAIAIIAAYCADQWGWRYALYVPGIICILGGLFLMERLRDTPQSLGLPPVERYRGEVDPASEDKQAESLTARQLLKRYVLSNPYIWLLAITYFFLYVIRTSINDWTLLYFVQAKGYSKTSAGVCVSWFELGGFFGSLAAGWLSDACFAGRRGPVNLLFMLGVGLVLLALWSLPGQHKVLDGVLVALSGFFVFGPQLLIGMAAAELAQKRAAGSATVFAGFFGYAGSAVAGFPIGKILADSGWDGYFLCLITCSLVGALLLLPLWKLSSAPRKEEKELKAQYA
jgi:OPA family sugar phosphate sensor protein UhpC-like MFS transporter